MSCICFPHVLLEGQLGASLSLLHLCDETQSRGSFTTILQGDRVCLYMPMVPEAAYAMLACARIGAVHSVRRRFNLLCSHTATLTCDLALLRLRRDSSSKTLRSSDC